MKRICPVAGVAVALLLIPSAALAAKPADTVLRGGTIRTFDAQVLGRPRARDPRRADRLRRRHARRAAVHRRRARTVQNLHGRTVMPGPQRRPHPRAPRRPAAGDLQPPVRRAHRRAVPGAHPEVPRRGRRRRRERLAPGRQLVPAGDAPAGHRRDEGDARRAARPTGRSSSPRATGTPRCVNSKGLQVAGITAATPDPPTGRIDRDAGGEPTGILEDTAQGLAEDKIPAPTAADNETALAAALKSLAAAGVTAVGDQQPSTARTEGVQGAAPQGQADAPRQRRAEHHGDRGAEGRQAPRSSGCCGCASATRPAAARATGHPRPRDAASSSRTASCRRPRTPRACSRRTSTTRAAPTADAGPRRTGPTRRCATSSSGS